MLRLWNDEVLLNIDAVLEVILKELAKGAPSPPTPLPQGAKGDDGT